MRQKTAFAVFFSLVLTSAAWAVGQARVYGEVTDENGEPIPGAQIVITHESVSTFRVETETDDRGKYSLTIVDATRTYTWTVSAEGYQTTEMQHKAQIHSNTEFDITILSEDAAQAQARELAGGAGIFNEGVELANQGKLGEAEARFREALEADPELFAAHLALARVMFQRGKYTEAAKEAEIVLATDGTNESALRVARDAYEATGNTEKEAEVAAKLAAANPEAAIEQTFSEGVDKYNAGDIAGAKALFEGVVAQKEDHAKAHYLLGLCMVSSGENAGAKEHLTRFLELAPDDPDAQTARDMMGYLE